MQGGPPAHHENAPESHSIPLLKTGGHHRTLILAARHLFEFWRHELNRQELLSETAWTITGTWCVAFFAILKMSAMDMLRAVVEPMRPGDWRKDR